MDDSRLQQKVTDAYRQCARELEVDLVVPGASSRIFAFVQAGECWVAMPSDLYLEIISDLESHDFSPADTFTDAMGLNRRGMVDGGDSPQDWRPYNVMAFR